MASKRQSKTSRVFPQVGNCLRAGHVIRCDCGLDEEMTVEKLARFDHVCAHGTKGFAVRGSLVVAVRLAVSENPQLIAESLGAR